MQDKNSTPDANKPQIDQTQSILKSISDFLKNLLNLSHDQDDNLATISSIEKGVEFRGINVWTLIFAIFVASIGLNVNSTAVIIGAMLISPLMGPIMGLGLSVGIYDFALLKKSIKNLSVAVGISVITSATYFLISPLDEAQSELLARTTPTIYDVLIALFGGMAGIVAGATKEKGNAIPGVAIATALMPPLCTAGFGIATGNLMYFLGAFYLFFINAVMISLSTFLIVRFLKFPHKQIVEKARALTVKKYILIIVTLTILPSIYFAYKIIQQAIFKADAISFVNKEFIFEQTQILNRTYEYNRPDSNKIELILAGETLDEETIHRLHQKLTDYDLNKTKLVLKQGIGNMDVMDFEQIKSGIIEDLYKKNDIALKSKEQKILLLESELIKYKTTIPIADISEEINAIFPKILKFSAYKTTIYNIETQTKDTTTIAYIAAKPKLKQNENDALSAFLEKRLDCKNIKLISEDCELK